MEALPGNLQELPVAAACVNGAGLLESANAGFADLFGFTLAEAPTVEEWFRRACPDAAARAELTARWQAWTQDVGGPPAGPAVIEAPIVRRDGTAGEMELRLGRAQDRIVAICLDVTERRSSQRQAEALVRLGTQLSAASTIAEAARVLARHADGIWAWDAFHLEVLSADGQKVADTVGFDCVQGQRVELPYAMPNREPTPMMLRVLEEGSRLLLRQEGVPADEGLVPYGDRSRPSLSLMFVPIRWQGRAIGVVSVQSYRARAYTPEDLANLQALVDLWGDALQRVRAEGARRAAEAELRGLFGAMDAVILVLDGEGRCQKIAPTSPHLLYRPAKEILGRTLFEVFPREQADFFFRHVREALERRRPVDLEYTLPIGGAEYRFRGRLSPLEGDLVVLVAHDVTRQRQAEDRLREQGRLLELARDAIMVQDLEGRITLWNPAAEDLTGYTRTEALGQPLGPFLEVPPEVLSAALSELVRAGEWSGELDLVRKDRKPVTVSSHWTLLRDAKGQPQSTLAVSTDITERKRSESRRLQAQRLEVIGRLASGVAHDLNNILAPIVMAAPLLDRSLPSEDFEKLRSSIEQSARRGADVARQVLTFARGAQSQREDVHLGEILQEMAGLVEETFPRHIAFCPQASSRLWPVAGDRTQILQVLMNLCLNARDAMPDGGKLAVQALNVTVDAPTAQPFPWAKPGPHVLLRVADTGCGIPRENLERVFDPFFTTKSEGQGTGLGLSNVLGIVKGHGGFLQLESVVGQGTCVEVYLPACPPAQGASAVPAVEPAATAAAPEARRGGECILVVDDERGVLHLLQRLLEGKRYRVLTASNGREALEALERHGDGVQLLITDLAMPLLGGLELIRTIRSQGSALPVIAITGAAVLGDPDRTVLEAKACGAATVLIKPFRGAELLAAVHSLLADSALPPSPSLV